VDVIPAALFILWALPNWQATISFNFTTLLKKSLTL
jgi:hypothetical protein